MDRLTKFVTPVGKCMTSLNSMKHYMPCVPCRHKAEKKMDANGKMYTEKHSYCDTCEVKMLFNRLKHYEDLQEQGRLIELPCAVGDTVYLIEEGCEDIYLPSTNYYYIEENPFDVWMLCGIDETVFLTKEEAEAKLKELEGDKE